MGMVSLVEETVSAGPLALSLIRPREAESLLDEEAFARDEFLPYWAELWPSALGLTRAVAELDLAGARVVELGCGLGLPGIAAARRGAHVLLADWSTEALLLATLNARRNGVRVEAAACSWHRPSRLLAGAPWDLVLASDVLYEPRDAAALLDLLPRLGPRTLLADPGRPAAREPLEHAEPLGGGVYSLTSGPSAPSSRAAAAGRA